MIYSIDCSYVVHPNHFHHPSKSQENLTNHLGSTSPNITKKKLTDLWQISYLHFCYVGKSPFSLGKSPFRLAEVPYNISSTSQPRATCRNLHGSRFSPGIFNGYKLRIMPRLIHVFFKWILNGLWCGYNSNIHEHLDFHGVRVNDPWRAWLTKSWRFGQGIWQSGWKVWPQANFPKDTRNLAAKDHFKYIFHIFPNLPMLMYFIRGGLHRKSLAMTGPQ